MTDRAATFFGAAIMLGIVLFLCVAQTVKENNRKLASEKTFTARAHDSQDDAPAISNAIVHATTLTEVEAISRADPPYQISPERNREKIQAIWTTNPALNWHTNFPYDRLKASLTNCDEAYIQGVCFGIWLTQSNIHDTVTRAVRYRDLIIKE